VIWYGARAEMPFPFSLPRNKHRVIPSPGAGMRGKDRIQVNLNTSWNSVYNASLVVIDILRSKCNSDIKARFESHVILGVKASLPFLCHSA